MKLLRDIRAGIAHMRAQRKNDAGNSPVKDVAVGFILFSISLLIALTVLPLVTSEVNTAQGDANITASQSTLLGLIPTVLIVALVLSGVGFMVRGIRGFARQ